MIRELLDIINNGGCHDLDIRCVTCCINDVELMYPECCFSSVGRAKIELQKYSEEEIFEALL